MAGKCIYEFVKDGEGRPIGCLLGVRLADDKPVLFGWSKYAKSKETVRFSKSKAFEMAGNRAVCGRFYSKESLPYALRKPMKAFVVRCKKYFKEDLSNTEN